MSTTAQPYWASPRPAPLDLVDIALNGNIKATYSGTTTSGTLTVTDGTHAAHIKLIGDYTSSIFTLSTDGQGGTKVVDPAGSGGPHLSSLPPAHAFIQAVAGFAGSGTGPINSAAYSWRAHPPVLCTPRAQIA